MTDKSKKDDTAAQLAKAQRAQDAKQAMSDYEQDALAVAAKTARLKALRLARDAAIPPPAPAPAKKKKKTAKVKAPSLAAWLDDQGKEGRRR